jgi:diguanylate cyclase (GGDEF)-like protein
MRAKVAAMTITMPNGESMVITASFGVATASPDDEDIHVVLQHADRALYRAKESGRNRVEVADLAP